MGYVRRGGSRLKAEREMHKQLDEKHQYARIEAIGIEHTLEMRNPSVGVALKVESRYRGAGKSLQSMIGNLATNSVGRDRPSLIESIMLVATAASICSRM